MASDTRWLKTYGGRRRSGAQKAVSRNTGWGTPRDNASHNSGLESLSLSGVLRNDVMQVIESCTFAREFSFQDDSNASVSLADASSLVDDRIDTSVRVENSAIILPKIKQDVVQRDYIEHVANCGSSAIRSEVHSALQYVKSKEEIGFDKQQVYKTGKDLENAEREYDRTEFGIEKLDEKISSLHWDSTCKRTAARVSTLQGQLDTMTSTLNTSTTLQTEIELLASAKADDQQKGAKAIACLCCGFSKQAELARSTFSTMDGGKAIQLLVNMLGTRNDITLIKATQALALLAVDDVAKTVIKKSGGIPRLLRLLKPKAVRNEMCLESLSQIVLFLCYDDDCASMLGDRCLPGLRHLIGESLNINTRENAKQALELIESL